jgi:hypothetical protein
MKKIVQLFVFLLFTLLAGLKTYSQIGVGLSITVAPPELPVYEQPMSPGEGYIWTPGYWAYGPNGYYWVPGVWVLAPQPGYLWTPSYWGFENGYYGYHAGYWGEHIGFYGGVNYGYGYGGHGYGGGRWEGGHFLYNTAISHVDVTVIHNTYEDKTVIVENGGRRTSFNGPGGIAERPRAEELRAANERHIEHTDEQVKHEETMRADRNQLASVNHGKPAVAAMDKPGGTRFGQAGHAAPPRVEEHQAIRPATPGGAEHPEPRSIAAKPDEHVNKPQEPTSHPVAPAQHTPPPSRPVAPPQHVSSPKPQAPPKPKRH